ncbi:MAG: sigma 54-interacting transcriptional regulator [Desulfarculaceae bacterium]|nr:sigma 54-interacting transcriptional regulator [Desulfarculaceae bacterium]MCF8071804.1 sigma 54-interacting transcriptional regulator [Desulfarculaceae bacterium]MCF8101354.1 sigma 54-interacting transcriptional regulator [Desulfarculaceae bacterium]MCF8117185.1 sigma 54-interacting transcriptional regulator [Desulfarculaceae bacterium]
MLTWDQRGCLRSLNPAAARLLELKADQCLGRPASDVLASSEVQSFLREAPGIGKIIQINGQDCWAHLDKMSGEPAGLVLVLRPDQGQVDDYLQKELASLLDNSYDGIIVADINKILKVNASFGRITGVAPSLLIDKEINKLDATKHVCLAALCEVIRLTRHHKKTVTLQRKLNSGNEIFVTCNPVLDRHHQVERVVINVRDITELKNLEDQIKKLSVMQRESDGLQRHEALGDIVAESSSMKRLLELVLRVSQVHSTVLLSGESGVGKDVIARLIHRLSSCNQQPFVSVNCGAIPENLLESEFFGYEKGAFTSASRTGKPGLFEQANGGTFFLDEVGELPLNLQVKLLKVIQDHSCRRLGSTHNIELNIRFIAASNRDLRQMVADGQFREDLFYRLYVVPITIEPLRERRDDILPLAVMFLKEFNEKYGTSHTLGHELMSILESYAWPGNVRELQNVIERLVVTADSDVLAARHLPNSIYQEAVEEGVYWWVGDNLDLRQARDSLERQLIQKAVAKTGNTRKASKLLGVDHSTVVRKAQRLGLDLKATAGQNR